MRTKPKVTEGTAPRPGPSEDEARRIESTAALKAALEALTAAANRGDARALADLRRLLDGHPEVWSQLGDLAAVVEKAWTGSIAGEDALAVESIRRQVAQLRRDLCGPHPTPTERLVVAQIGACWLAVQDAEIAAARQDTASLGLATLRFRRVESAQRRYLGAVKLLTLLRAKVPQGLAPLNSVRIFPETERRA
jgi:hypothetical protein